MRHPITICLSSLMESLPSSIFASPSPSSGSSGEPNADGSPIYGSVQPRDSRCFAAIKKDAISQLTTDN
jgi:hypothetical protein